jgi:hypothetical protein
MLYLQGKDFIAKERFPTQPGRPTQTPLTSYRRAYLGDCLFSTDRQFSFHADGANLMSHQTDFRSLTLAGVAHRCSQETERFFHQHSYDPRYCFELFYRAIVERNQRAWDLVYVQYRPLVTGWVERHPAFANSGEETQYFVNRAFEKMWAALPPEKFGRFPDLKSILRYLQMCVHSAIVDFMRLKEQETLLHDDQRLEAGREASESIVEQHVFTSIKRQELWHYLNGQLKNDKERRVVYGMFFLALKPRELYAQFQDTFQNIQEVYRIKENLIARLRRDSELRQFLNED